MPRNLYALCRPDTHPLVKRIPLGQQLQAQVQELFDAQEHDFLAGIEQEHQFDGGWTPEAEELLTIELAEQYAIIEKAFTGNALAVRAIDTDNIEREVIKALCLGGPDNSPDRIRLQSFNSRHLLTQKFSVFMQGNAFRRIDEAAFTLDSSLAGVIDAGTLKFKSYHKVRAIFDLQDAYQEATNEELQTFAAHPSVKIADEAAFMATADQTTRKLIHGIQRNDVLNTHEPNEIRTAAESVGLVVEVKDDCLHFPTERQQIKLLLRFLDDGLYRASLSNERYVTNSKRPI